MKRVHMLLLVCALLLPFMVAGQHAISEKIQQNAPKIQQTTKYTPLTEIIGKSAKLPVIPKAVLSQKQFFQIQNQSTETILNQKSEYLQMTLAIDGQNVELQLMKANILTDDFRVVAASTDEELDLDLGTHYWGIVKGMEKSLATISFFQGEIVGSINFNNNQYTLGKVADSDYHILYNTKNLNHNPDFSCAAIPVNDDENFDIDEEEIAEKSLLAPCVRIHVELDNDLFQQLGGTQNSTNYMNGVFAEVATLYANENISIQISFLRIWDTPSPYGPGNGLDALTNQGYGRTYGDLVHLVRASYGGGVAYLNQLCGSTFNTGSSGVFGNFQNVPTYSWDVNVIAHELGHNFGSPHTHNCSWSGGAIDGCGAQAGFSEGCNGPIPSNGGTIMSYCHLNSVGVNFSLGFGPQPGNLIRSRYNSASCLQDCGDGGGGGGGEPTCTDGIQNGNETSIDCGGSDCPACPPETCDTYNFNVDPIIGYDPGQDFGPAIIQDGGATVFMNGNAWKALQINYTVTPNTVIEFDFRSTVQGEIHEVGFDNDLIIEPNHRMVIYGNQGYNGTLNNPTYSGNGNWQSFAVNIGAQFTGTFTYLVLTADDDANAAGNSYFRNINIYEDNNGNSECDAAPPETCDTYNFNVDPIIGYDPGQDFGPAIIQDGGASVFMNGNAWKALQINYPVSPNTVIEFDFRSTVQGEIHEVGFDNDLILEPNHRMVIYGNQGYGGTLNNPTYSGNGSWQSFAVNIGAQFTGTFTYLVLTADDDANAAGNSYFRNINIYEDNNGDLQCGDSTCAVGSPCDDGDPCTAGETFDTNCNCNGGTFQDSDGDGVCNANDACPGQNDNIIGTACDDGNPCTTGETYNATCDCTGGTLTDSDGDGICDTEDPCPADPTNTCGGTPDYCSSQGSNTNFEYIQRVIFGNVDNDSGDDGGYGDYTNQTITVGRGDVVPLGLVPGFSQTSYSEGWSVWIDFNRDGDFDDAGENVYSGASTGNITTNVNIPLNATPGATGMRVAMQWQTQPLSCSAFTYGEVEDYTVNITNVGGNYNPIDLRGDAGTPIVPAFRVSPNPAKDFVDVGLQTVREDADIQVLTMYGQILWQQAIGIETTNLRIPLNNLPAGVYFIRVNFGGSTYITERFVKLK